MQDLALWISDPCLAHQQWRAGLKVANRAYATQSDRLYRSLFGRFCNWMRREQKSLVSIRAADLKEFLASLEGRDGKAAGRTLRTYLAEIDRVLAHVVGLGLRSENPATVVLTELRDAIPLQPRSIHLPRPDCRAQYLQRIYQNGLALDPEAIQSCAINMLMMDCGFTLKEIQKLSMRHVSRVADGLVDAAGHRLLKERTIRMSPEAKEWLQRWLKIRATLQVISRSQYEAMKRANLGLPPLDERPRQPRSTVFVGFTGKSDHPQALRGSGLVIDRLPDSTIYQSAQAVMLGGLAPDSPEAREMSNKGPQALRNLCCAALLARNQKRPAEIAAMLGLRRVDQVWAMVRVLKDLNS